MDDEYEPLSLQDAFGDLKDPRVRTPEHDLTEMLVVALAASLSRDDTRQKQRDHRDAGIAGCLAAQGCDRDNRRDGLPAGDRGEDRGWRCRICACGQRQSAGLA